MDNKQRNSRLKWGIFPLRRHSPSQCFTPDRLVYSANGSIIRRRAVMGERSPLVDLI